MIRMYQVTKDWIWGLDRNWLEVKFRCVTEGFWKDYGILEFWTDWDGGETGE